MSIIWIIRVIIIAVIAVLFLLRKIYKKRDSKFKILMDKVLMDRTIAISILLIIISFIKFIPIVSLVISIYLFLYLLSQDEDRMRNWCLWLLGIAFLIGFGFYTYGYFVSVKSYTWHELGSLIFEATFFGLYNSFRMFFNEHDFAEIGLQNYLLRGLFWLSHLFAIVAVQVMLLNLFFRKIVLDNLRIRFGLHKNVYIIKGNDENAICLGRDIATKNKNEVAKDKSARDNLIIYWLEEDDDEHKMRDKAKRFNGIVKVISNKDSLKSYLEDIGLLKNIKWLHKLVLKLLKKLGLHFDKRYIFVLMPNDISVSDDTFQIVDIAKKHRVEKDNIEIYVITPTEWDRDNIEEIIGFKENNELKYPYKIHLTNEVDLITRKMIKGLPPYMCLTFNKGKATKNFKVMIIGFGEMGQAALLRLILNGQFVYENKGKMKAILVDKNIDYLKDSFMYRYPAINDCCEIISENNNLNVPGGKLLDLIDKHKDIDYIVIAIDDTINKQTALGIRQYYRTNKTDKTPYIAVISDPENRDSWHKKTAIIKLFGSREEIYNADDIIREEIDKYAEKVHLVYGGEANKTAWRDLDWHTQESNRATADYIDTMLHIAGNSKEEKKKIKDNPDAYTSIVDHIKNIEEKKELIEVLAQTEHLRWNAFHIVRGYQKMETKEMHDRYALYMNEKDMNKRNEEYDPKTHNTRKHQDFSRIDKKAKRHVCLVSWDELEEVSTEYKKIVKQMSETAGNNVIYNEDYCFKKNDMNIVNNIVEFLIDK